TRRSSDLGFERCAYKRLRVLGGGYQVRNHLPGFSKSCGECRWIPPRRIAPTKTFRVALAMTDAILRKTSPCHHGKDHHIREAPLGVSVSVRECRDSKGFPKNHHVTHELYPEEVRRR